MGQWTRERQAEDLMERLQAAGVPAGVVENYEDLFNDPQLKHRGHFVYLEHTTIGKHAYDGTPVHLSASPAQPFPAPCLGEHTERVMKDILKYGDDEIATLVAEGALE